MPMLALLFLATVVITEPSTIHAIEVADLNHDGWIDLVTQNSKGYTIHLNRKGFHFEVAEEISQIGIGESGGLALADINHDSHIDLISGSHDSYRVAVLLGDGTGQFKQAAGSPFFPKRYGKPHNHRIAIGDLNGDKHPDIVAANIGDGDLSIFLGDGKASFLPAAQSPLAMGPGPYAVRIADINLDGSADLIVASTHDVGPDLQVALNRGDGTFARINADASHKKVRYANLELVNWNRDGHLDALVGPAEDGGRDVLLGDSKGGFQKSEIAVPAAHANARLSVRADFNRDGKVDVLSVINETGKVQID